MVKGMCPVLTGRVRKNVWAVGLDLSLFGLAVFAAGWLYRHPNHLSWFLTLLPWISGIIVIGKMSRSWRLFARACRTGLYSVRQWRWVLTVWSALLAGIAVSAYLACAAK